MLHQRHPGARSRDESRDGVRSRRQNPRAPCAWPLQHGRPYCPASAELHGRQHHQDAGGRLRCSGGLPRLQGLCDQHHTDQRLSGRRPVRRHLCRRATHGQRSAAVRPRPRRDPPAEFGEAVRNAVHDTDRRHLRLRRFSATDGVRTALRRLGRISGAEGGGRQTRAAARHRRRLHHRRCGRHRAGIRHRRGQARRDDRGRHRLAVTGARP